MFIFIIYVTITYYYTCIKIEPLPTDFSTEGDASQHSQGGKCTAAVGGGVVGGFVGGALVAAVLTCVIYVVLLQRMR